MVKIAPPTPETVYPDGTSQLLDAVRYVDQLVQFAVFRAQSNASEQQSGQGLFISDAEIRQIASAEIGQHHFSFPPNITADTHQTLDRWVNHVQMTHDRLLACSAKSAPTLPLNRLIAEFNLDLWELNCLLLALAPEIDARFGRIYSYLQNDITQTQPTVDLILNLLTDQIDNRLALRNLFTPQAKLFATQLLCIAQDKTRAQLTQPVTIAPAVFNFLLGSPTVDQQLQSCVTHVTPAKQDTVPNQAMLDSTLARRPIYAFVGGYGVGKRAAAEYLAIQTTQPLLIVDCTALSKLPIRFESALILLLRDGRLQRAVLLLNNWDTLLIEGRPPTALLKRLLAYPHSIVTTGRQVWYSAEIDRQRPLLCLYFEPPNHHDRLALWQAALPNASFDLEPIAASFILTQGQIRDVCNTLRDQMVLNGRDIHTQDVLAACRIHSNQRLAKLAVKVEPRYGWNDIILPDDTRDQLHEAVNMVKRRHVVYEQWGFGGKMSLGKGMNALFAGDPGTGKTMAAEIIASDLGLDLYKIDLSMIVDKYIGETEKNIGRIFDEATTSNAILFFDEADAIFGKRGEVKDSHDRHANIEVSYLLQRVDAFDGVVILATNLRSNIDEAFTRRLHFAIQFPFPEVADRERIWRVTFPKATPLADDINFRLLAKRFELSGGNIRNIVLASAFLAAKTGAEQVTMAHLLQATRREHQKMGHLIHERLFAL